MLDKDISQDEIASQEINREWFIDFRIEFLYFLKEDGFSLTNITMFGLLYSLSRKSVPCNVVRYSNGFFCNYLGIKKSQVTKHLSFLKECGLIEVLVKKYYEDGLIRSKRVIIVKPVPVFRSEALRIKRVRLFPNVKQRLELSFLEWYLISFINMFTDKNLFFKYDVDFICELLSCKKVSLHNTIYKLKKRNLIKIEDGNLLTTFPKISF